MLDRRFHPTHHGAENKLKMNRHFYQILLHEPFHIGDMAQFINFKFRFGVNLKKCFGIDNVIVKGGPKGHIFTQLQILFFPRVLILLKPASNLENSEIKGSRIKGTHFRFQSFDGNEFFLGGLVHAAACGRQKDQVAPGLDLGMNLHKQIRIRHGHTGFRVPHMDMGDGGSGFPCTDRILNYFIRGDGKIITHGRDMN